MPRIEIWRDAAGVPLVKGKSERDVFFGLGAAHARDRLLQMTALRILGEGRSAELLADHPVLLDYDIKLRSLDLLGDARAQVSLLSEELAGHLAAYADGVNFGMRKNGRLRRSLEMRIAGIAPVPWEPYCSLLVLKVMAFVGLTEIQEEAERFVIEAIRRGADEAKLKELFHPYLEGADFELVKSIGRTRSVVEASPLALAMAAAGSNAFAVSGARSVSGKALIANDPHLQVNRLPAIWMEAMTEQDGRRLVGSTIPGGPGFISARSRDLAWCVTYSMADNVDFFVEEVKGDTVRRGDSFEPLATRAETIGRRGKEPLSITVRESRHGVIEGQGDGRHLAMAWSGQKGTGAATFRALHDLSRARGVDEAMAILRTTDIPPLNWVVADRAGNAAWQLGGRYPVRREGWSGLYPVAGWEPQNDWRGFMTPEDLPSIKNPDSGVVVTANDNRNVPGKPLYVSVPHPDCRARRIEKILDPPGKVHLDILRTAQLDVKSLQVERLLPRLLPHLPDGPEKDALSRWDHRYTSASRESTLFENLYRELLLLVFGEGGLGREWLRGLFDETSLVVFLFGNFDAVLARGDSLWLPKDRRDETIREAARRAFARPWPPWGEACTFTYAHLLLGERLPRALGFDRGPYPLAGSRATPRQGSLFRRNGRPVLVAPSYRILMEMGDEVEAETCLPGGSSERRLSRFYAREVKDYLAGRYKKLSPRGATRRDIVIE